MMGKQRFYTAWHVSSNLTPGTILEGAMSLMDDVFDMRDFVKGTDMEEAFNKIETRLWKYEQIVDEHYKMLQSLSEVRETFLKYKDF